MADIRSAAENRDTIEDNDRGAGGGGGGGDGGGNNGGGGGGGGGGDDDDDIDNLTANRAEVIGLFAHLLDGSDDAHHFFLIDEYDDFNSETADFEDWRVRQSMCVEKPGQNREMDGVSLL